MRKDVRRATNKVLLTASLLLSGCRFNGRTLHLEHVASTLPADGREHLVATVRDAESQELRVRGAAVSAVRADTQFANEAALYLRTPVQPGTLRLNVDAEGTPQSIALTLTPDTTATPDGTPDWMRLHTASDREAFRRWFVELAERAADAAPEDLPPEITDCASLIRYAFREALTAHDDRWYAQFKAQQMPSLPSVQQWQYPKTPLGANLFRTRAGPFRETDLTDGTFTQFADAKTLRNDNSYLLGRDLRLARPGDLIFYRVLETDSQYHSMIITGEHGEWVVYNTGPDHGRHGEMRRVLLADLLRHPDPQWRPEPSNPNWLGVYRWNILREK